ncbi:transposase [Streptomyces sp. CA-106110]|uniref:transposase n=1 Tax=Streptomyces sp. CA-106110 TaxID=3240044 RepID=UPI003D8F12BC
MARTTLRRRRLPRPGPNPHQTAGRRRRDRGRWPSTLSARARLLATGGGRRTDANDARHGAQVALFRHDLRGVDAEDRTTILRLLTERHDDLVHERTRVLNRLHAVLRDLLPGGAPTGLSADKAAAAVKAIRPVTATDACRRDIARDLLADLRLLDRQVKDNEAERRDAFAATRTTLTALPGLGTVLAAKVIGRVGDVSRFPTERHFADYTGSAPLDASSGNNVRHRLNTGGNRALNSVLHIVAVCQIRDGGSGQEYYLRKIAQGKTPPRSLINSMGNRVLGTLKPGRVSRGRRSSLLAQGPARQAGALSRCNEVPDELGTQADGSAAASACCVRQPV